MRANRLLSILILLQLRGKVTADALAAELEVSVRTVYRDIDELCAAGVPIYADRGPGGGFTLLGGYETRLTGMNPDEAEALFLIGMPEPAAALGLGRAAATAGRKLQASLAHSHRDQHGELGDWFHLDPNDWHRTGAAVPHLRTLARAVIERRKLAMTYESWTGTRHWLIEPWGLVLKAGNWYVVARARARVRIFKVANITSPAVQDAVFERPANFDLAATWTAELERFESGLRPGVATVRVSPVGLSRLAALGDYAKRAISSAGPPGADGWAEVLLPIERVDIATMDLLSIGPEVAVIEPEELRHALRNRAAELAELNGDGASRSQPLPSRTPLAH